MNRDLIQHIFQWGTSEGILDKEEQDFVYSILSTHKTTAREIMVPLIDVVSIEADSNLTSLIKLYQTYHYTRIPVYEERVDNIIGYISCKDFIFSVREESIRDLIRECVYIPETKTVDSLLLEMQKRRVPIVFVVNEYGGFSGIITVEDIAEEIVGEIPEEYSNEPEEEIVMEENNKIYVPGYIDVDDLNYKFNLSIKKAGFETIAGFVLYKLGRFPEKDEWFTEGEIKYTVIEADSKSVYKILIEK